MDQRPCFHSVDSELKIYLKYLLKVNQEQKVLLKARQRSRSFFAVGALCAFGISQAYIMKKNMTAESED